MADRRAGDWMSRVLNGGGGVGVLPYGAADGAQRRELDQALQTPGFLTSGLRGLAEQPDTVLVVDLPPGPVAGAGCGCRRWPICG